MKISQKTCIDTHHAVFICLWRWYIIFCQSNSVPKSEEEEFIIVHAIKLGSWLPLRGHPSFKTPLNGLILPAGASQFQNPVEWADTACGGIPVSKRRWMGWYCLRGHPSFKTPLNGLILPTGASQFQNPVEWADTAYVQCIIITKIYIITHYIITQSIITQYIITQSLKIKTLLSDFSLLVHLHLINSSQAHYVLLCYLPSMICIIMFYLVMINVQHQPG